MQEWNLSLRHGLEWQALYDGGLSVKLFRTWPVSRELWRPVGMQVQWKLGWKRLQCRTWAELQWRPGQRQRYSIKWIIIIIIIIIHIKLHFNFWNIFSLLMRFNICRWPSGLWRPRVLFQSSLSFKPIMCHRPKAYRYSIKKTTTCNHSLLLWTDEVSHWRGKSAKLRSPRNVQRKVTPIRFSSSPRPSGFL